MSKPLHILQLAPRLPYPLDDGGRIGMYNITKHVAALGHRITMLAYGSKHADTGDIGSFCELRIIEHDTGNRISGALRNVWSPLPYTMTKYRSAALQRGLQELLGTCSIDVVHVDHIHLAFYGALLQRHYGLPYVLREHNFETTIHRRYAESKAPPLSWYLKSQAQRLYKYESEQLRYPDIIAAITEEDAEAMRTVSDREVRVIPAGVDIASFANTGEQRNEAHVVLLGSLQWSPNLDAASWFVDSIWPLIVQKYPQARCTIAGSHPPASLKRRENASLHVAGFVDDLDELLSRASVLAIPLRIGGGMRIKLLEFFARGKAVVSTSIGAEGNCATDGKELLIADSAEQFASAVVTLLRNPDLASRIGGNARMLVEQQYSCRRMAEEFEHAYYAAMSMAERRGEKHHSEH